MNSDFSVPNDEKLNRYVGISIGAHVVLVFAFMIRSFFFASPPIEFERAVRVDLVGLPDKVTPQEVASPAPVAPVETSKAEEKTAVPEEKPASKLLPQKKPKVDTEAVNLEKSKTKQKDALNRLKQMEAMEKLEREMEAEKARNQAAAARQKLIKGNQVSSGSQLTGLAKLQAESYIGEVENQIRGNWALPPWLSKKNLSAQIRVRFDEKGNVISTQIVKSSGNPTFDEIVVDTVRKSSPVPPPPEKFVRMLSLEGITFGFPE